ncbi:hypothetical protein HMPREF9220_1366 [Dialister micraerophilus UPII 345-E]|uniref:Uncharacterized protein n=1 Tax=Dialister micraerophilus UPII 345-E TaxID=910314 RepID=E4L773_9FIRM|nr:hypothetical protein HMPREF9220_1366 [Dialister micraerophilus UPII 345-E]
MHKINQFLFYTITIKTVLYHTKKIFYVKKELPKMKFLFQIPNFT